MVVVDRTLNHGLLARTRHNTKRPVLDITLDTGIAELPTNQTFGIEDGVNRIHCHLILGSVTDEALGICECDIGGCRPVTLVVGNDLHAIILPYSYATANGKQ